MKSRVQSLIYIILFVIGGFCIPVSAMELKSTTSNSANDSIYQTVDKVPVFKKAGGNVQKFLSKQIQYPIDALAKEIEGKVMVTFVVSKDGDIANVEIVKGLYESIDKEALRVVSTLDKWKPGILNGENVHTKVTIPVHFYISEENKEIAKQIKPFYSNDRTPLFVIDKKKVTGLATLEYYNVKSIRVIKGKKAIELYGEEAKNGVLVVETKRGTEPVYKRY